MGPRWKDGGPAAAGKRRWVLWARSSSRRAGTAYRRKAVLVEGRVSMLCVAGGRRAAGHRGSAAVVAVGD